MYEFRDDTAAAGWAWSCSCTRTRSASRRGINPFDHGSAVHTDMWKTEGLKQALDDYGSTSAFGGARRDEEKSRAKERIFSIRSAAAPVGPEAAAPGAVAHLQRAAQPTARRCACSRCRTGPSSTCGSTSTSSRSRSCRSTSPAPRPVVERDGTLIMVDDDRMPLRAGEVPRDCAASGSARSAATRSPARSRARRDTLTEIIQEMLLATTSERQGRVIDHDCAGSMEKKKQEGYF